MALKKPTRRAREIKNPFDFMPPTTAPNRTPQRPTGPVPGAKPVTARYGVVKSKNATDRAAQGRAANRRNSAPTRRAAAAKRKKK